MLQKQTIEEARGNPVISCFIFLLKKVTNNPVLATHVVTSKLRRTLKLIAAMNVCEYVVTPLWVEACFNQSKLLPVKDEFLLQDPEGESVYCCSIQESLKVWWRGRVKYLFAVVSGGCCCPWFWLLRAVIVFAVVAVAVVAVCCVSYCWLSCLVYLSSRS